MGAPRNALARVGGLLALTALLVAALAVGGIWPGGTSLPALAAANGDTPRAAAPGRPGHDPAGPHAAQVLDEPPTARSLPAEERAALRGRLRSAAGVPLDSAALVTWTELHLAPVAAYRPAGQGPAPARLRTHAADGRFQFTTSPIQDVARTVVVALHPEHFGVCGRVTGEPLDLVLDPAPPLRAEVVSAEGAPVPGASVELRGLLPLDGGPERHELSLHFTSDEHGRVDLFPLPGTFALAAAADGTASGTWHGTHDEAGRTVQLVRLVLRETFTARGRVLDPPAGDGAEYSVRVRAASSAWDAVLARIEVDAAGGFESAAIPWTGAGDYVFRVEGPDICPQEKLVRVDHSDEAVDVEFTCRPGVGVTFRAEDSQGAAVAGVLIRPYWWEDGRWVFGGARLTDDEGLTRFDDLLPGSLGARTSRAGYVDTPHGQWDVVAELEQPLALPLESAGRLSGRVTYGGQPVEDFEIRTWSGAGKPVRQRFQGRRDGTFLMDRLPRGQVGVYAFTDTRPPSPPLTVEVPAEGEAVAELALDDGRTARGQVIDVASGLPIAGADVQVWSTTPEGHSLGAFGAPARTSVDGRFDGLVLPSTNAMLAVRAKGYEEFLQRGVEPEPVSGDVGVVGLSQLQALTVQLLAPAGVDLTGYRVRADTDTQGALVPANAEGVVTLQGTDSGLCRVNVFPPGGGRIETDVDLVAGKPWVVSIPVGSRRTVVTEVAAAQGHGLPEVMWINAVFSNPQSGTYSTFLRVGEGGRTEFACAHGERAVFEVMDAAGQRLATRATALDAGPLTTVPITVQPGAVELQLVDGEGQPLAQALVSLWVSDDPLGFHNNARTDSAGKLTVRDFGAGRLSFVVSTTHLQGRERRIDLREARDGEPLVVRVEGGASVRLRLTEAGAPAPNVRAGLRPHGIENVTNHRTSDAAGELVYAGLEPGTYELNVQGNGWWPLTIDVEASPDPAPREVRVRRKGALLLALEQAGLAVAGARVELSSLTPGDDVSAWAAVGAIGVAPATWVSGVDGGVRVTGLPAGEYRWLAVSADGSVSAQGSTRVTGGLETPVVATFP